MLEELRSLNESTKRNILIVSTIIVMAVIVYVWFGYFNGLIAPVSQAPVTENQPQQSSGGYDLVQSMQNGLANVANGFRGAVQWFGDILRSPGRYVIKPK